MSDFATIVGYIVICCGGVALVALLGALAMDYVWTVIKRTYDMETLGIALREHEMRRATEPSPETKL